MDKDLYDMTIPELLDLIAEIVQVIELKEMEKAGEENG